MFEVEFGPLGDETLKSLKLPSSPKLTPTVSPLDIGNALRCQSVKTGMDICPFGASWNPETLSSGIRSVTNVEKPWNVTTLWQGSRSRSPRSSRKATRDLDQDFVYIVDTFVLTSHVRESLEEYIQQEKNHEYMGIQKETKYCMLKGIFYGWF